MDIIHDRFYSFFETAYKETDKYLVENLPFSKEIEDLYIFASQVLFHCFPADFKSIQKVGWFPIDEATIELEYSLFLAKGGAYKAAYMSLRSFLELNLTCFYFLFIKKRKGYTWIKGKIPTPFKRDIMEALFRNKDFIELDKNIQIKDKIERTYGKLNDICHTKGESHSHMSLSKANYPRFIQESYDSFIQIAKEVVDIVITCFVVVNPIILFPVPLLQKFGINSPVTGFLEEYEVEILWKLLKPESLQHLRQHYESDPEIISIREEIENRPDISDEELRQQLDEFDEKIKQLNIKNIHPKNIDDTSSSDI